MKKAKKFLVVHSAIVISLVAWSQFSIWYCENIFGWDEDTRLGATLAGWFVGTLTTMIAGIIVDFGQA
ncbi:MAG: hypothetical protein GWN86_23145 [Desulfobacterales bacterium]|nr:hypothetical protein [Desulfobacterales bacterium]